MPGNEFVKRCNLEVEDELDVGVAYFPSAGRLDVKIHSDVWSYFET